jgi:hypothetical protein
MLFKPIEFTMLQIYEKWKECCEEMEYVIIYLTAGSSHEKKIWVYSGLF